MSGLSERRAANVKIRPMPGINAFNAEKRHRNAGAWRGSSPCDPARGGARSSGPKGALIFIERSSCLSHSLGECCVGFSQLSYLRLPDNPAVQFRASVAKLTVLICRTLCPQSACRYNQHPLNVHMVSSLPVSRLPACTVERASGNGIRRDVRSRAKLRPFQTSGWSV